MQEIKPFCMGFWKYQDGVSLEATDTYNRLSDGEFISGLCRLDIDHIKERLFELQQSLNEVEFDLYTTPQFVKIIFPCFYDGRTMNLFPDLMVDYGCPVYHESNGKRLDEFSLIKGENYYI